MSSPVRLASLIDRVQSSALFATAAARVLRISRGRYGDTAIYRLLAECEGARDWPLLPRTRSSRLIAIGRDLKTRHVTFEFVAHFGLSLFVSDVT